MQLFGAGGQSTTTGADSDLIFDVGDADFMEKVVEASRTRPVIVDFWAAWCGPCKALGPIIEDAVKAQNGKVALAKIDTDRHQMVAQQLRVQSLPTVLAFVGGQPVDGFTGALTPAQVKQFVEQVVKAGGGQGGAPGEPSIEDVLSAAEEAMANNAVADASQLYAAALQMGPTELRAIAGLARVYTAAGDFERARQTLQMAPEDKADDPAISAAAAAIDLAERAGAAAAETAKHRAALEADPNNHQARLDLALGLVAAGDKDGAVSELLEIFKRDRAWNEEAAKTELLKLFEAFGSTDPATIEGRRKLSSMMFA